MRRLDSGFILIYVVALVAALALILFQINQMRSGVPRQQERIIARMVEQSEATLLLDFMLSDSQRTDLSIDTRYQQFRKLLTSDPASDSELEDAVEQLRAALASYGMIIQGREKKSSDGVAVSDKDLIEAEGAYLARSAGGNATIRLGERDYLVKTSAGNQRPNLNSLPFDSLFRYLAYLGLTEQNARQLAADLIDWRDADDFRTEQLGAEREYYLALTPAYPPRNQPFASWQEVAYVRGVSPEGLHLLRENFSLGDVITQAVLFNALKPEALAALADLEPGIAAGLLNSYRGLMQSGGERKEDLDRLLLTPQALALDKFIAWSPDERYRRIEISGPNYSLSADYDLKEKRLLGSW